MGCLRRADALRPARQLAAGRLAFPAHPTTQQARSGQIDGYRGAQTSVHRQDLRFAGDYPRPVTQEGLANDPVTEARPKDFDWPQGPSVSPGKPRRIRP